SDLRIACGLRTPGGPPAYGAWELHAAPPLQSRRSTALARNTRRRPKQRATLAAFALILGGGGMMAANVYASATEDGGDTAQVFSGAPLDCPDVATELTSVPEEARAEVDKELAALDARSADPYTR